MLFNNAKFYNLTTAVNLAEIERQLAELAFRPCGNQETSTMGWASPVPQGQVLCHVANGFYTVALKKEERLLPSRVINRELSEKVEAIEAETGSPVGKKAQSDLKQEIITRLLPQAFTDHSYTYGTIIPESNLVIVNAPSDSAAEAFLAMLRKTLGSLPVIPMVRHNTSMELTHWLTDETPSKIELLEEAELKATDDSGSTIKAKNTALDSEEIQQHLDAGKLVQKVAIEYDEAFYAVFDNDGSLKRIKFTDRVIEENADIPKDQVAAKFDADVVLGIGLLVRFADYIKQQLRLSDELQAPNCSAEQTTQKPPFNKTESQTGFWDEDDKDVFQDEAVAFVIETRRASVAAIQRKFRIGYNRAARIIEQMESDGIVSKPSYNGSRDVLIPPVVGAA